MVRIFEAQELEVISESRNEDDVMKDRAHWSTQNQAILCHSEEVKAEICAMARKDPFCTK